MRVVPLLAYLVLSSMAFAAAPPRPTLLDLAKTKFAPRELTDAEQKLFTNTERGEPASALTGDDKQDDPASAANWPDARVVHAECLAWLCTDREASRRVTFRGIQIHGMRIDGKLDLEFAQAPFPFWTWKCAFTNEIVLRHAHFPALYLQFTHVKSIDADGAKIDGNIFLRDHFKAAGEVRLLGGIIGRNLECDGAQLSNPKGMALNADGAKINGGLYLRRGFKAIGEVDLIRAAIGGDLDCDGAELFNPDGYVLNADRSTIDGGVYLRSHFKADGGVGFFATQVKSQLNCYNTLPAEHTWFELRSA